MQWKRKDSFCYLFTEHKLASNNTEILNIILSSLLTHVQLLATRINLIQAPSHIFLPLDYL